VKQVIIHKLVDGVFYSSLICERDKIEEIIDARTSDAIALALRFNAPIFTYQNILEKAGIYLKTDEKDDEDDPLQETQLMINKEFDEEDLDEDSSSKSETPKKSIQDLEKELEKAVNKEDYEEAARLRDEISKRK